MKKLLALILCAALLLSVLSFAAAEGNDLPEAFAHITFDGGDEGYKAITNGEKDDADPLLDGANKSITDAPDAKFLYGEGPVGQALYIDGTYGLDLGLKPTNTDAYTIAFWTNADRLSTYGPTLQIGYNVSRNDTLANVTWMNITQSEWGTNSGKIFPVVWSRNKENDSWPWCYSWDDGIHGKREWVHIAVVTDGTPVEGVDGSAPQVNVRYYINGQETYDSAKGLAWANGALAPNIMKPGEDKFESYFGINFWDTIFKGYVDDLYVFDTALSAEQVAAIYAQGNGALESPKGGPVAEAAPAAEEAAPAVEVKITGTAVGATDMSTPFWGAHSDIWAVPDGEYAGVIFTNYNAGEEAANWNNFNVVLQNTPTGHAADQAEGYAEYAVVRSDNYGWGAGYEGNEELVLTPEWEGDLGPQLNGAVIMVLVQKVGDKVNVGMFGNKVDGTAYSQTYENIKADGDVYFCLVVDGCCLDIQQVLGNEDVLALLNQ